MISIKETREFNFGFGFSLKINMKIRSPIVHYAILAFSEQVLYFIPKLERKFKYEL